MDRREIRFKILLAYYEAHHDADSNPEYVGRLVRNVDVPEKEKQKAVEWLVGMGYVKQWMASTQLIRKIDSKGITAVEKAMGSAFTELGDK